MSFGAPWFFLLFLLLPPLVWRVASRQTRGRLRVPAAAAFTALPSLRATLWWLPDAVRLIALSALIVALTQPRVAGQEVRQGEGVGMELLLDMSRSMVAVDLSAQEVTATLEAGKIPANRFETAREVLKQFVVERNQLGADQIGLIIFGAEAWVRYPMTHDHARLIQSLNGLVLDEGGRQRDGTCANGCTIDGGGTAIGDALRRAYSQLSKKTDVKSKVIVLITDGKEMGGTTPATTVTRLLRDLPADERIRVYTFQVGGKGEMYVPRIDMRGRPLLAPNGLPVYEAPQEPFAIDPDLLKEIANATGGKYYDSYSGEKFKEDIADLARTAFSASIAQPKVDVFEWPLAAALALLALEWLLRMTLFRSALS